MRAFPVNVMHARAALEIEFVFFMLPGLLMSNGLSFWDQKLTINESGWLISFNEGFPDDDFNFLQNY